MLGMLLCALTLMSDAQTLTTFSTGQLGAPAQPPGQPLQPVNPGAPPPAGTSTVRGHVFAADSGQPLRKAQVRMVSGEIRENRLATTDVDGAYEFKEVRAGRYAISANKGSYVGLSFGQQRPTDPPRQMAILDNQIVEKMDFALTRGSVISGRILDEFGEPMSDVQVAVQQYQTVQGQRRLVPTGRQSSTNDIGEFRLFGVSPGQYYIVATWRALNPVNDTFDKPAQAQRITLAVGEEKSDIVMALRPIRATRVSGTAIGSDGKPMTGAVLVTSTSGYGFNMVANGPIRPDGTFQINGIAPGEYTLRAQAFGPGSEGETATAKVTATGEDIKDLRLLGVKPSSATGRIVVDPAAAAALPPGLMLFPMPIEPGAMPMGGQPTRMSDDGTFEMKAAPGRMRINMGGAGGWVIRSIRLNGIDVTDAGVEFKANEDISGLEIEITNKLATITGLVTNARGETVKDYSAIAFAQDREKWKIGGRYQAFGRPDQDGRFKMSGLTPADYYIVALEKVDSGQLGDPDYLESLKTKATAISIREGESRTVDLKIATVP
jgi:hypothetical protein